MYVNKWLDICVMYNDMYDMWLMKSGVGGRSFSMNKYAWHSTMLEIEKIRKTGDKKAR